MNENEKLMDFILGDLDKEGEQQLFASLAFDEELRDEMKTMMKIKTNISANISKYVEPVSVKSNIFRSLGYTFPGYLNKVPTTDLRSRNSVSPVINTVIACLLSIAGTYLLLQYLIESNIEYIYFNNTPIFSKIFPHTPKILADKNSTYISEEENSTPVKQKHSARTPLISMQSEEYQEEKSKTLKVEPVGFVLEKAEIFEMERPFISLVSEMTEGYGGLSPVITGIPNDESVDEDAPKFSVEVKNAESWSIPRETIEPLKKNSLNNYCFTSLYKLNDKFSIGPDIRQETFYVEYTGKEAGISYKYYQQPNLTTFGLALRYTPFEFGNIHPFTQVAAGFNKGGYTGRLMGGTEVRITENVGLVLGIEYSLFLFPHEKTVFDAHKFNLNYGVIVRY